jgi:hypothetical protein
VDTLERLVASVLVDITKAQDCANRYSSALAAKYRDVEKQDRNANLMEVSVPNSLIKAVEVRLTFALPKHPSSGGDGLAISYSVDELRELDQSVLSSITLQIEMRSYGLGYGERVPAGEAGTSVYTVPRE